MEVFSFIPPVWESSEHLLMLIAGDGFTAAGAIRLHALTGKIESVPMADKTSASAVFVQPRPSRR